MPRKKKIANKPVEKEIPVEIAEKEEEIKEIPIIINESEKKVETEKTKDPEKLEKPKKNNKKAIILTVVLLIVLSIGACYQFLSKNIDKIIDSEKSTSLYQQFQNLLAGNDQPLKGEKNDRINILLLGIGGENHNGGTLTDTIMIASIKPSTKQVALISLPRDLMVRIHDQENKKYYENRKINYAYELGGIDLAKKKAEEVTGLKMHYYTLMDFSGFTKLVDDIGGVEVDVPTKFNGYYHITDCGGTCKNRDGGPVYLAEGDGPYCIIKFQKGAQKMNGEKALMFARIRKVAYSDPNGEYEGSDFARSRRQQKILEAFQKKAFATSTLINPVKITNLINDLGEHLRTNLQLGEMAKISLMLKDLSKDNIINKTIDDSENGFLYGYINPDNGAYLLMPNAGENNFKEIQKAANNIFNSSEKIDTEKITATNSNANINNNVNLAEPETADIIVLNGTATVGLAAKISEQLKALGLTVSQIGNAPTSSETNTLIFDQTQKNPQTLEKLKQELNAEVSTAAFEEYYSNTNSLINYEGADLIVVLGVS